jgi:hypothetical protein
VAMAEVPSLGSSKAGSCRELGASVSASRRVCFLPQIAGVQKRDPPLASTAQSGVESQQDDAGACADLVLVHGRVTV